jgi:hypothetical protein
MKNLSIVVAVTALIAFSLGYFARGPVEGTPNISKDTKKLPVREHTEIPVAQAQTIVCADPRDANAPFTASVDHEAFITSTNSTPRELYAKNKSNRLGDFFLINGIGAYRAEQIIQDLVDADHYLAQKGNAMLDHHTAEKAELIARGDVVEITHTTEEKAEIEAEREKLYRQVFGEFYEAYEIYRRSYPQRRVVGTFSSSLPEPLEYTAKEYMVQIMYEEHSHFVSELESQSLGSDERLPQMRSFNDRVLDRTRAYLTPSQFEQFKRLLDDEVRRVELLIKMAELDKAR